MNTREVIAGVLSRDSSLVSKITESLRQRIAEAGPMAGIGSAADAIEPVIANAVNKRPSRLARLGLKSAQLIAGLAGDDGGTNERLAKLARDATVGIVFVDVAAFMAITAKRGDEAAIELLSTLEGIIERRIRAVKGEYVKRLGDGFLLAFPSASQAVRGAASIRDGVHRQRVSDSTFDLNIRIAVHSGEPLIDQADLIGFDVNLAARLLDHCDPDDVVVSASARELAVRRLRRLSFENERMVKIRGLSSRVSIYSLAPA